MTTNKARLGVMVSFVAIGLLLWGRLILLERIPRIATADPDAPAATAAGDASSETNTIQPPTGLTPPDRYNPNTTPESGPAGVQAGTGPTDVSQGQR